MGGLKLSRSMNDEIEVLVDKFQFNFELIKRLGFTYGLQRTSAIVASLKEHTEFFPIRVNTQITTRARLVKALNEKEIVAKPHPDFKEAILIELEPIIQELCKIIKDEIINYNVDKIWINISTSTKLFVSAAMYVGSLLPDKIKLFYIDASNYTVNDLFNPEMSKEEIKNNFEEKGITYKEDGESYKSVDVPSYPFELLSEKKVKHDL